MPVRDTSILAYHQILHMSQKHKTVYQTIKNFPDSTDRELAAILGFHDPNKVRPRRNELAQFGWIRESGKRECSISGRLAYTWRVT